MIAPAAEGALVSFAGCLVLTPAVCATCARHRILDFPGPLKIHVRPVPRLGGVAVALSIIAGVLVGARGDPGSGGFFLGALGVVWIAGIADDLRSISPYARLAAQVASGVLLWLGDWRLRAGNFLPSNGAISLVLVCGTVLLFANALNFLDGSDGLACGVAAITGAALFAIPHSAAHDPLTPSVAACVAASCAAFLFYNFAPAAIHLGDSGSTVLGICVAFLAFSRSRASAAAPSLGFATFLISALPIADFAFTVFRRLRARASLLRGDRFHLYDRMLARGYSPSAVALFFYAITIALAAAAWLSMRLGLRGRLTIGVVSLAGVMMFAAWLGALTGTQREAQLCPPPEIAARKET